MIKRFIVSFSHNRIALKEERKKGRNKDEEKERERRRIRSTERNRKVFMFTIKQSSSVLLNYLVSTAGDRPFSELFF